MRLPKTSTRIQGEKKILEIKFSERTSSERTGRAAFLDGRSELIFKTDCDLQDFSFVRQIRENKEKTADLFFGLKTV